MWRFFIYSILFLVVSCSFSQEKADKGAVSTKGQAGQSSDFLAGMNSSEKVSDGDLVETKQLHDFSFRVHFMRADDFQKRKGREISEMDVKQLKREQVMLFEIKHKNPNTNILEKQLVGMDENELVSYYASGIQQDLIITQGNKEIQVNGVYYESVFGASNRLRCIFYISGLKPDKEFEVLFNDKIFGNDLIKYNFN